MSCCDARSTLPLLLDGQLAAAERAAVIDRVMACQLCLAELSALAQNDGLLQRALTSQATTAVPAGYFEDFWPRLAARLDDENETDDVLDDETLEGDSMRMSSGTGDKLDSTPPQSGDLGKDVAGRPLMKDEVSGLHEIKELAANTVARANKRPDSEPHADEALLARSSGSFGVVLPQPGKEVAPPVVRHISVSDADGVQAAPLSLPAAPSQHGKPSRVGLYIGAAGLLVAAAAIGMYLTKGAPAPAVASAPVAAGATDNAPTPVVAEPIVAAAQGAPKVEAVALAEVANATPAPKDDAKDEPKADDKAAAKAKNDEKNSEKVDDKSDAAKSAAANKDAPKAVAAVTKDEPKADAKAKDAKGAKPAEAVPAVVAAKEPPKEAPNEIDAIFGDKPAASAKPAAEAGPALPEKLGQDDVKKGMGSVKARVQSCYDEFKVPGTIKLKVKIEADGHVSSAEVVDAKFSGTDTGTCVSAAIKTAKFPAVSGSPLVVSYPFILQ